MKSAKHDTRGLAEQARELAALRSSAPPTSEPTATSAAAAPQPAAAAPQPAPASQPLAALAAAAAPTAPAAPMSEPPSSLDSESHYDGPESHSDGSDSEDAIVVGYRNTGDGAREKLMHWIGYGKDECEYQTNENSLESDTVVEKTIEINCASGDVKTARVNSAPSTGPMYQLKWCGQSARHLERDQREFLMDLVCWVDESVVGWKVCGYDEDMD